MTRIAAAALVLAAVAMQLSGCAQPQGVASSSAYAPYSEENNPFCGALGNCQPLSNEPYPMRGSSGW